jgi:hypothetical protein
LPITPGARTLGLLAPPERDEQPYLWSPTALLQIPTSGAELTLAPQPIQPETITLQFTHPEPDAYSLAVTCDAPRGGSALIALGATWDRDQARLALAPAAPGSTCQIIATASPQGSGAALVAFTAFAAGAPPAALRLPPLALTEPQADDDARALSWDPIPGADAYDLFLAHRDGDAIAAPFWSATTAQTRLTLPALPPELTARIDRAPQRPLFARVVARFAPGLDLERNWDWSDYYGYTASPWVEVPPGAH